MPPPSSSSGTPKNEEFAPKLFMTRKRSLARRSMQGPPKGLFNIGGITEGQGLNQSKRPSLAYEQVRSRPVLMVLQRAFKIDLMIDSEASSPQIGLSTLPQRNFSGVEKKIFNTPQMLYSPELGGVPSRAPVEQTEKKHSFSSGELQDLEYRTNIRLIHRQFNINKFNVLLKTDLFKDVKDGKTHILRVFDKVREAHMATSRTPVANLFEEDVDWEFWRLVIDHYPSKMTNVRSLKRIETAFLVSGVPKEVRALVYMYLTNSKSATLERIYKENSLVGFFPKENDLRLRICETFNTDLRCMKLDLFSIADLNKELLQKVDKDVYEVMRNFTTYYDRGGYAEIKGLLAEGSPEVGDFSEQGFYLPSKGIILLCQLLLSTVGAEEGVLELRNGDAKLSKPEIFSLLIMLNENYFNFDNNINARNLRILKERKKTASDKAAAIVASYNMSNSSQSSRRLSITIDLAVMGKKETELNNIKSNYRSDYNKERLVYVFNRSLEDLFPEVYLYLSLRGINTNILLERFVFEFFHRFLENYKLYDDENHDECNLKPEEPENIQINGLELNNEEFETIKALVGEMTVNSIGELKGGLSAETTNAFFQNGYKLSNESLLRILDMVLIQGVEFLVKFLLLVIEKNYFTIFKIHDSQVLMKFLLSNAVFNFLRDENVKFVMKKVPMNEIGKYEAVNLYAPPPVALIDPDATIQEPEKMVDITVKEPKSFSDFIVEALKFEPVIYKYEEELKLLEKERRANNHKSAGIYSRGNTSETSLISTITNEEELYSRNSSTLSLSSEGDANTTPELLDLRAERKDNKVRLMKLQTDMNSLTLTHKSYKEEILLKNESLNKIRNINMELKLEKEALLKRLNELKLREELFHCVLRNSEVEKLNNSVKGQIESLANDIRVTIEETDRLKDESEMMKQANEGAEKAKSKKASPHAKGWFGWGK